MLKINRSAVNKVIAGMELFTDTKEVLANYAAEKEVLEERENFLNERLKHQQEQYAITLISREAAKDNPSEYVQLSRQLTEINADVKVLLSLQSEFKGEYTALKEKYMPLIRDTYYQDISKKNAFNVNEAVGYVRDELKQVISDYESEISKQEREVMPVISKDFLQDSELMSESWDDPSRRRNALAFKRTFHSDRTRLDYGKEIKL